MSRYVVSILSLMNLKVLEAILKLHSRNLLSYFFQRRNCSIHFLLRKRNRSRLILLEANSRQLLPRAYFAATFTNCP